jgi:hypothetical protein
MQQHETDAAITYLGWSGFRIRAPGGARIFIDPPKGAQPPEGGTNIILLTHGHPEHLGGALCHLRHGTGAGRTVVVASPALCRYLAARDVARAADFLPAEAGGRLRLADGVDVEVFGWRHMPLLPPGPGAALRHIGRVLAHPRIAWRIVAMAATGPGAGPLLGFRLRLENGAAVIAYGEGLHRRCALGEPAAIGRRAPGATLLVAAEPEDAHVLPDLIAASGAARALLYEPHAEWRDAFSMPRADLAALRRASESHSVAAHIVLPGNSVGLSGDG